jgi:hypothetical protein
MSALLAGGTADKEVTDLLRLGFIRWHTTIDNWKATKPDFLGALLRPRFASGLTCPWDRD